MAVAALLVDTTGPKVQQLFDSSSASLPDISLRPDSASHSSRVRPSVAGAPATTASASSFKSGSSLPMTATQALEKYDKVLTDYEKEEIRQYPEVWYVGATARKIRAAETKDNNFGFDDEKNRYKCIKNDHVSYRYEILKGLGKGSYGDVVKAFDHKTKTNLAIKIIRNERRFHKQAQCEVKILDLLRQQDTRNTNNVIHMTDYFLFRNHLCITFQLLHSDLYSRMKSDGFKGFSIPRCRAFTRSLITCLRLLRRNRIVHCDLKPENILLVAKDKDDICVIDFGSSCFESEKVHTYIQSRFYRSPEVILAGDYGLPIDMWSLGCILAELHTGHPLFPGRDEKEQLLLQMEILGVPPRNVRETSKRSDVFFHADGTPRFLTDHKGRKRDPGTRTLAEALESTDKHFVDFIQACLDWDPHTRMTPRQACAHEFIADSSLPRPTTVRSLSAGLASVRLVNAPFAATGFPSLASVATETKRARADGSSDHATTSAAALATSLATAGQRAPTKISVAPRVDSGAPTKAASVPDLQPKTTTGASEAASFLPRPARLLVQSQATTAARRFSAPVAGPILGVRASISDGGVSRAT